MELLCNIVSKLGRCSSNNIFVTLSDLFFQPEAFNGSKCQSLHRAPCHKMPSMFGDLAVQYNFFFKSVHSNAIYIQTKNC